MFISDKRKETTSTAFMRVVRAQPQGIELLAKLSLNHGADARNATRYRPIFQLGHIGLWLSGGEGEGLGRDAHREIGDRQSYRRQQRALQRVEHRRQERL